LSRQELSKGRKQDDLGLLGKYKGRKRSIAKKNQLPSTSKDLQNGIAKLVLTIVKVLVELLEKQAERRVIAGNLTSEEIERLGLAFIAIRRTVHDIITKFGFKYEELDIPIASVENKMVDTGNVDTKQLLSAPMLVDILDRLINKQTVIGGQIVISVADVDLIVLNLLGMLLSSNNSRSGGEQG